MPRSGRGRVIVALSIISIDCFQDTWRYTNVVNVSIELDREDDGRWIAEALELPGVMTYGETREEAISNTERLAIEVIADRIRHGELPASSLNVSFSILSEQLAGN
jgi:predicted RNase H-like HicB family nuclease